MLILNSSSTFLREIGFRISDQSTAISAPKFATQILHPTPLQEFETH